MTPELPASFTVRPASTADLDDVVELLWAVAAEGRWLGTEIPFDRAARRGYLADLLIREDAVLFVAADVQHAPPRIVGHLSMSVTSYGVADVAMALDKGWRGRGIGTALLDAGLAWARSTRAHKVFLEVWPDNTAALALYRGAGFVEEGRKLRHYRRANGELWDAILMGRPLP